MGEFTEIANDEVLSGATPGQVLTESDKPDPLAHIAINDDLTVAQRSQLLELLQEYKLVFASPGNEGHTTTVTHRIPLLDGTSIVRTRRVPYAWRHEVNTEIGRMRDQHIIRPSSSEYAASMCPVRKKDGSLRLCVDYRALNEKTRNDAFPTSNLPDVLDYMVRAQYFSILDLAHGYHQIPVNEEDKHKTAFRPPTCLWEFNVMPFGLKGAPATFCRLMHMTLGHMSPEQVALYMDDVCHFAYLRRPYTSP